MEVPGAVMKSRFQKFTICFVFLAVAHLLTTVAFARTDEDLASIAVDGEWLGAAGDKLGGMFLEDVMDVYWDTPSSGGNNTNRGPVSSPAVTSCDFDGDGYPDLAIGAPGGDKVYLFFGDPFGGGGPVQPAKGPTGPNPGFLDLSTATNYDVVLTGGDGSEFGIELASDDVNGDGYCDLLVGASGLSNTGAVVVYFGKTTATHANTSGLNLTMDAQTTGGDSFDGYNVRYFGEEGYTGELFVYNGPTENLGSSVACVDLNGDGVKDLAMGAPCPEINYSASGNNDTGSVYVVFGGGAPNGTGTDNLGTGPSFWAKRVPIIFDSTPCRIGPI